MYVSYVRTCNKWFGSFISESEQEPLKSRPVRERIARNVREATESALWETQGSGKSWRTHGEKHEAKESRWERVVRNVRLREATENMLRETRGSGKMRRMRWEKTRLDIGQRNRSKMGTSTMGPAICFIICCNMITALSSAVWIPAQPKQNIWVIFANKTGQDMLALSTTSPRNPFSTCLVGQLLDKWPILSSVLGIAFNTSTVVNRWDE